MTRAAFVLGSNGPDKLGRLKRLKFAESDATAFAQILASEGVGWSVHTPPSSPTRNSVIDSLDALSCNLGLTDELLFYFAGHGIVSHGDLYLVLDGTLQGRLAGTALPWVNIKQIIRQSAARDKVVILDCCHAGQAVDDPLGGAFRGTFDLEAISAAQRGSTASILVACGPDVFAREGANSGGGYLTALMIEAIGPQRQHAADPTGQVSLQSLRDWMWQQIDTRTNLASIRNERPRLIEAGGPTFYLTQGPQPPKPVSLPSQRRHYPDWWKLSLWITPIVFVLLAVVATRLLNVFPFSGPPEIAITTAPPHSPSPSSPGTMNRVGPGSFALALFRQRPLELYQIAIRTEGLGTKEAKLILSIGQVIPNCTPEGENGHVRARLYADTAFEDGSQDAPPVG